MMTFGLLYLGICMAFSLSVNGCGVISPGRGEEKVLGNMKHSALSPQVFFFYSKVQQERTLNFIVTNFKLPAIMAFCEDAKERAKVANISATQSDAQTFVQRLIMQPVEEVLYDQGRSALLPDQVISSILQQLNVRISYEPLKCETIIDSTLMGAMNIQTKVNCIVIEEGVTNLCSGTMGTDCEGMQMILSHIKSIDSKYFSISGSLTTSNAVMANWSNQMWERVLNRVLRRITSGQYGSFFYGASVNIS